MSVLTAPRPELGPGLMIPEPLPCPPPQNPEMPISDYQVAHYAALDNQDEENGCWNGFSCQRPSCKAQAEQPVAANRAASHKSPQRPTDAHGVHRLNESDPDEIASLASDLDPPTVDPVMAPFEYIRSLPSKGVREKLISALDIWVAVSPETLPDIKSLIADVHNLSLILDDVQDGSPLRRGRPAAHSVFGMPQAVNSATFQVVDVISRTRSLGDSVSLNAVIDEMKSLLVGQAHDLLWTHLVSAPTIYEYLRMVDGKTGGLFRMISRLMIAQSQSASKPRDLDRLMTLFGRFFQIRDDYANLTSNQYTKAKGFCEDLDEGKYSFILIHAMENASPQQATLLHNMLVHRRTTGYAPEGHKEFIMSILEEVGSIEYTGKALRALQGDLKAEIRRTEKLTSRDNPILWRILGALEL